MATYTVGVTPITVVRERPWTMPMVWQDPDDNPIDITAYSFAATMRWEGSGDDAGDQQADVTVTVTDAAAGEFVLALDNDTTARIPDGEGAADLYLTVTDGGGDTSDFRIPITGQTP